MVRMPPTTSRVVPSSDLSRHSADVLRAAEEGPVEITRRDGESLVLTRKSDHERQFTVLNLAADLIAASLGPDDVPFVERLQSRLPWMAFLSDGGRTEFARSIVATARACAAVRDFGPFLVELHEWHATAEAMAAGYTRVEDIGWYDDPVPVPDPRLA